MIKKKHLLASALLISVALILSVLAVAGPKKVSLKGEIRDAEYVRKMTKSQKTKLGPKIVDKDDFVFLLPGGDYYLLPNIDRNIKARHAGQQARITGKLNGQAIIAERIELKRDIGYETVWAERWEEDLMRDLVWHG